MELAGCVNFVEVFHSQYHPGSTTLAPSAAGFFEVVVGLLVTAAAYPYSSSGLLPYHIHTRRIGNHHFPPLVFCNDDLHSSLHPPLEAPGIDSLWRPNSKTDPVGEIVR
jgi:hypothetical protein